MKIQKKRYFTEAMLEILYEDECLIAINKPSGLLVHRTRISEDEVFALQMVRRQIGVRVFPAHRLDRGTSGVLLFGKDTETAGFLGEQFRTRKVSKTYDAIVRGFLPEEGQIDSPLLKERTGESQESLTTFRVVAQSECPWNVSRYPTSRYSRINIWPLTGRWHQIRRHFAHLRHPVIGDRRHGDCKHNNFFRDHLGISRMLLHAESLKFHHPHSGEEIQTRATPDEEFRRALDCLGLT